MKIIYKKSIREGQESQTASYTNDLHDALLNISGQALWQVWNPNFENKLPAVIPVDGTVDNTVIANTFANYFASNCSPSSNDGNDTFKLQYNELREYYIGSPITPCNLFNVEIISNLIMKMDNRKAAGLDKLTSKHLKFSHPIIVCILISYVICSLLMDIFWRVLVKVIWCPSLNVRVACIRHHTMI